MTVTVPIQSYKYDTRCLEKPEILQLDENKKLLTFELKNCYVTYYFIITLNRKKTPPLRYIIRTLKMSVNRMCRKNQFHACILST